jgi:hypothetical protein
MLYPTEEERSELEPKLATLTTRLAALGYVLDSGTDGEAI